MIEYCSTDIQLCKQARIGSSPSHRCFWRNSLLAPGADDHYTSTLVGAGKGPKTTALGGALGLLTTTLGGAQTTLRGAQTTLGGAGRQGAKAGKTNSHCWRQFPAVAPSVNLLLLLQTCSAATKSFAQLL